MIERIAEHYVDLNILPLEANVLDLGCRGYGFTNAMRELGHNVKPVDCDLIDGYYYQLAIEGYDGEIYLHHTGDPQGTYVTRYQKGKKVKCMTIESFSKMVDVDHWHLIKIDVEGSEYPLVMSLDKAPADQLSIEFHLHCGVYDDSDVKKMEDKLLSLGYFPVKHDKTRQHGLNPNYWDSLFILNELIK